MAEPLENGDRDLTSDTTAPNASAPDTAAAPVHRHRLLIGTLFALATVIGVFAVLAVWTNRQALNVDNWTSTSTQLLANKEIQTAVAAYSVNQLFKSGVPQAELKSALPTQLEGLAGPLTSGLQQVAGQVAPRLLATTAVQSAWRQANHAAATVLLKIVNGGGSAVSTNDGVVTLDLHAVIAQLASSLGVEEQVAAAQAKLQGSRSTVQGAANKVGVTLPPSSGQLVILRSNQLKTVQDIAKGIKGLALVLPIVALFLFMLAVGLSKGRRQQALRLTGWCLFGIGIFALVVRRVTGNVVVDALIKNPDNRPAGHQVWMIATTLLYDIAVALVVYGLVIVVCAWLGGQTRPARALRRALAPTLRERPIAGFVAVYIALLLVILWGPTPATRQIPYIALFIVLIAVGMHVLRGQVAREFPAAQRGDAMRSIREWNAQRHHPVAPPPVHASTESNGGRIAELERLATLHDSGALTDAEFRAEKAVVMNGS
jgi:Short C-terminal domain